MKDAIAATTVIYVLVLIILIAIALPILIDILAPAIIPTAPAPTVVKTFLGGY